MPFWCLRIALWPPAAVKTTWELACGEPTLPLFRRLPASIRGRAPGRSGPWRVWLARIRLNVTKFMLFWPDRLATPRWRNRLRFSSDEVLERLGKSNRPVILAVLHVGPLLLLRYCLRSRGLAVAGLLARPLAERSPTRILLDKLSDEANGTVGIPNVFDLTHLRALHDFLQPNRMLIVALDGGHGNHVFVPNGDSSFRMASGAVRLAAHRHALVVPCLIRVERAMKLCIHLGEPVPEELLMDPKNPLPACAHLFRELLPLLRAHPEEGSYEFLCRFRLDSPARVPSASARDEP